MNGLEKSRGKIIWRDIGRALLDANGLEKSPREIIWRDIGRALLDANGLENSRGSRADSREKLFGEKSGERY